MGFSDYYQDTRHTPGIYALKKDEEIVYIGSSRDIYTRLLEHKVDEEKDFDSASSIETIGKNEGADSFRKMIEMGIICQLKPKYNKIFFDNYKLWLFSLPCENIKKEHVDLFVKEVDIAISNLSKGGHYEYKTNDKNVEYKD